MLCGVKFCGGCNPRYDRGKVLRDLKEHFDGRINFEYAEEGVVYDTLLVIGGCTSNCASYEQYEWKDGFVNIWDISHYDRIVEEFEALLNK